MLFKSKARNKIKALERDNNNALIYNISCTAVCVALIVSFALLKNDITVHIPPDLSDGATLKEYTIPEENVYLFAGNIWRAINYWEKDGKKEMDENLDMYQCYLTPTFRRYLSRQHESRIRSGMTQNVARTASSIRDSPYGPDKVMLETRGQWESILDLRIQESLGDSIIRNVPLRYRLVVVADDSSSHCNPWGMKLAGLKSEPVRLVTGEGSSL